MHPWSWSSSWSWSWLVIMVRLHCDCLVVVHSWQSAAPALNRSDPHLDTLADYTDQRDSTCNRKQLLGLEGILECYSNIHPLKPNSNSSPVVPSTIDRSHRHNIVPALIAAWRPSRRYSASPHPTSTPQERPHEQHHAASLAYQAPTASSTAQTRTSAVTASRSP